MILSYLFLAVRDAADLLDKMLKELIKKFPFDFDKFIPLFSERVNYLNSPDCRRVCLIPRKEKNRLLLLLLLLFLY